MAYFTPFNINTFNEKIYIYTKTNNKNLNQKNNKQFLRKQLVTFTHPNTAYTMEGILSILFSSIRSGYVYEHV